eukprot:311227_1
MIKYYCHYIYDYCHFALTFDFKISCLSQISTSSASNMVNIICLNLYFVSFFVDVLGMFADKKHMKNNSVNYNIHRINFFFLSVFGVYTYILLLCKIDLLLDLPISFLAVMFWV